MRRKRKREERGRPLKSRPQPLSDPELQTWEVKEDEESGDISSQRDTLQNPFRIHFELRLFHLRLSFFIILKGFQGLMGSENREAGLQD